MKPPPSGNKIRITTTTFRLQCVLPAAALAELLRREKAGEGYRSEIARRILCNELIGHVNDAQHRAL